ncbi:hypothetical protein P4S72_07240 [Vibrio sp. PP-XX7]
MIVKQKRYNVQVKQLSAELDVAFGTSGVRGLVKDLTPALCFAFVRSFLQRGVSTSSRRITGFNCIGDVV